MKWPLVAAVALVLAWPASGHVGDFAEGKAFAADPYSGTLEPADDYIYDNRPAGLRVLLVEKSGPGFKPPPNSTVITWTGRRGTSEIGGVLDPNGTKWEGSTTFPAPGQWNVTLTFAGPSGNRTVAVPFMVYKQLGYRIKPVDPGLDPYLGQRTTLAFRQVWHDMTLQPYRPAIQDLWVRIERWDSMHTTMLSAQEVEMAATSDGWSVDHEFKELGMFHMSFRSRSGGFGYEDMPIQHTFVVEGTPQETDFVKLGLYGVIVLGSLGLVWYAWRLRRNRRQDDEADT